MEVQCTKRTSSQASMMHATGELLDRQHVFGIIKTIT